MINEMPKLFLIRGLSGSGKSRWLRENSDDQSPIIRRWISADDFFVDLKGNYIFEAGLLPNAHLYSQRRVRDDFEDGYKGIAVHNTFSCRWEMQPYLEMAKEFGAEVVVIDLFDGGCTDQELFERNIHGVPLETITAMRARWEHDWENRNPIAPWMRNGATVNDFPWTKDD